ncbi:hypothetical protein EI94DRAFT_947974 [Lactarius quietus]|nr:hypothetical protein EI94DRAFT_947974 [Lactarius quietus]
MVYVSLLIHSFLVPCSPIRCYCFFVLSPRNKLPPSSLIRNPLLSSSHYPSAFPCMQSRTCLSPLRLWGIVVPLVYVPCPLDQIMGYTISNRSG